VVAVAGACTSSRWAAGGRCLADGAIGAENPLSARCAQQWALAIAAETGARSFRAGGRGGRTSSIVNLMANAAAGVNSGVIAEATFNCRCRCHAGEAGANGAEEPARSVWAEQHQSRGPCLRLEAEGRQWRSAARARRPLHASRSPRPGCIGHTIQEQARQSAPGQRLSNHSRDFRKTARCGATNPWAVLPRVGPHELAPRSRSRRMPAGAGGGNGEPWPTRVNCTIGNPAAPKGDAQLVLFKIFRDRLPGETTEWSCRSSRKPWRRDTSDSPPAEM